MPSALALLLYSSFVVVLLWIERRGSRDVSAATWIPTIWMLSISSKSLSTWFGIAGSNEAGSRWDQFFLVALAMAGAVVLARRRAAWSGAFSNQGWLLALLAYQCVSAAWSDIPSIAFRRWVREAIILIMALIVISEPYRQRALESVLRRSAYVLIPMSVMLIKYFPALGREYARWSGGETWLGVSVHKNGLASLCLISAFLLFWALYRRWREPAAPGGRYQTWTDVVVLLLALFLLKGPGGAYSATSIGAMLVGIIAFLALLSLRRLRVSLPQSVLLGLVALLIVFGASTPFLGGSNVAPFGSALGRDETLTGRTDTWAELVPVVERQLLLGSGFGSFWTTQRRDFYQMSDGHNGYLDVLLDLGAVGLAFYVIWMLSCARKLHAALHLDYIWASLGICFLLMAAVYNTAESALEDLSSKMPAVVVLVTLAAPCEKAATLLRARLGKRQLARQESEQGGLASKHPPRRGVSRRSAARLRQRAGSDDGRCLGP